MNAKAERLVALVHMNSIKANIIQLLFAEEVELAGICFKRASESLSFACKQEIAFYAYRRGEDFAQYYFGSDLPKPEVSRWGDVENSIQSVEDSQLKIVYF